MRPRLEPLFFRSPQIRFAISVATCLVTAVMTKASSSPPAWLLQDASLPPMPAALHEQNQAEILRAEVTITISEQGEWREVQRYAVRVRHPGGEKYTRMGVGFVDKSDEIVAADAWLLPATGKRPTAYQRKDWANIAEMNSTTLYTDIRWLTHISTTSAVGDVYGGEVTVIRRHNSGQGQLTFGGELPLRRGRLAVQVPSGWRPDVFWLKGRTVEPRVSADGSVWTWELADVPAIRNELWAPRPFAPYYVALKIQPPSGTSTVIPRLETWADFAQWNERLIQPQCDTSAQIKETVARLTAGLTDPWAKLEALARFAQKQTYIQQYENSGIGFGYRPRLASDVLRAGYGDCKDKANLMEALLREAGFRSHIAIVLVGIGRSVQPDWPGQQFNHAITAIELPDGLTHSGEITHPVFGRLLFFDPTHPWVPLGELPWYEHGGLALIVSDRETRLTRLPDFTPEQTWGSDTRIDLTLLPSGALKGALIELDSGESAAEDRARAHLASPAAKRDYWVKRIARSLLGIQVADPVEEDKTDGRYQTHLEFSAREFGQFVQDKFLLVRLDLLTRNTVPVFPAKVRAQPLVIRPVYDAQEVWLPLPPGSAVTELPKASSLVSDYGRYSCEYTMVKDTLVFKRSLTLRAGTIPPEHYRALQTFLGEVAKAEATVVMIQLQGSSVTADHTATPAKVVTN
ncbi:MAG TPA: transglutaminase-like domain-containing protein [Lacunisphaera sp.]|jgi:hypothetical protein